MRFPQTSKLIFASNLKLICSLCSMLLFASLAVAQEQQRGLQLGGPNTERRVALVVGNGAYETAPLKNPVNDAQDMAQALRTLGFDVLYYENLNQNDMKRAIRAFGAKIRNGGIALFYYAGHGTQVNGVNYLIPIGAKIEKEEEVEYECVDAGFVLAQMDNAGNRMNIVILDACRNNPFARGSRSVSGGLAQMNAPSGTLIAYSTAPNSVASDGKERNGIYTQELLKSIRTPGLAIEEVFKRVRISVRGLTQEKQTPWESSSLVGDFYFSGADKGQALAAAPPLATQPSAFTQPTTTPVSAPTRSTVSLDLIESNFQSNLLDEVIKDGESFLASQPDHARVNLRVGQSYFRKNQFSDATPYLEKAFAGGESISLPVKRHRKSLGIYDALEDGFITVSAAGIQMQFGDDTYTMPFAQQERLEAQPDQVRGMLIYLKGTVINKKGKAENKDYKLFAPSAVIVPMPDGRGNQVPVAICQRCESWTTEVVKFINRAKATTGGVNAK